MNLCYNPLVYNELAWYNSFEAVGSPHKYAPVPDDQNL